MYRVVDPSKNRKYCLDSFAGSDQPPSKNLIPVTVAPTLEMYYVGLPKVCWGIGVGVAVGGGTGVHVGVVTGFI